MPTTQLPIPINGYTDSMNHQHGAEGFTTSAMNILPMDNWEHRRRVGTRQGFAAMADMGVNDDQNIQLLLTYEVYRDTTLVQEVLIVAYGLVYYADANGNTHSIAYDQSHSVSEFQVANADKIQPSDKVRGIQFGNYVYLVNGRYYYMIDLSATTPVVQTWRKVADGGDIGLPAAGTNKATLITRFGGRIVLAGIATTNTNWFMCTIGDVEDWTYDASDTTGATAIAGGSATRFGKLGEPIVALFPFGDSGLMVAGRNTLTYMTNDPAMPDAQFVKMSNGVGVMGPDAWCQGPEKTCFIASADGVYRLEPNMFNIQRGQSLTAGRLDNFFASVSPSRVDIHLAFDPSRLLVIMFVNRQADPTGIVHYVHHLNTQSWWPIKITDTRMDSLKSHCLYRPSSGQRDGLWLGFKSGRISMMSPSGVLITDGAASGSALKSSSNNSPNDGNGAAFQSRLAWSPLNATVPNERLLMTEMVVLLDNHEFPTLDGITQTGPTLNLYGADMAQVLSGVSGSIGITETRLAITGGAATGSQSETAISGGTHSGATGDGSVAQEYETRARLELVCEKTATTDFDEDTLIFVDNASSPRTVTLTFDKDINVASSAPTSATAGTVGISDTAGSKKAILKAVKLCLDQFKDAGLLSMTCKEPGDTSLVIIMDDSGSGTTVAGTAISEDDFSGEAWAAINKVEFIDGGASSTLSGTLTLDDPSANQSERTWTIGNAYKLRLSGVSPDIGQYEGYWGLFEPSGTKPKYIASAQTEVPPESTLTSTEILPSGYTASTVVLDSTQDDTLKELLETFSLSKGRNKRFRLRKRSSDFQVEITASGTSWVLEDISVDLQSGGKYKSVS